MIYTKNIKIIEIRCPVSKSKIVVMISPYPTKKLEMLPRIFLKHTYLKNTCLIKEL